MSSWLFIYLAQRLLDVMATVISVLVEFLAHGLSPLLRLLHAPPLLLPLPRLLLRLLPPEPLLLLSLLGGQFQLLLCPNLLSASLKLFQLNKFYIYNDSDDQNSNLTL